MRIVRIALVALAVLAGATACKNSDSEDKSLSAGSVLVASAAAAPAVLEEGPLAAPARL